MTQSEAKAKTKGTESRREAKQSKAKEGPKGAKQSKATQRKAKESKAPSIV